MDLLGWGRRGGGEDEARGRWVGLSSNSLSEPACIIGPGGPLEVCPSLTGRTSQPATNPKLSTYERG
jgi:hypothetical protein